MRNPALWLYLLGAITILSIALRRVLHRQVPLSDELYSKQIAIDHVHSGVGWIRSDGTMGSVNPGLAKTLAAIPAEVAGKRWTSLFPAADCARVEEFYRQSLLMGKTSFETAGQRFDGTRARVEVLLVAVHDHRLRLIGHHILVHDRTRELELEERLKKLTAGMAAAG